MIERLLLSTQRQGKCDLCKSVQPLSYEFIVKDAGAPSLSHGHFQLCKDCATALSVAVGLDKPHENVIRKEFSFKKS